MDSSRLSFKLFVKDPPADFHVTSVVPVFHSWIQTHAIQDHLLIDVADYAHVHNGPGIVLVSHEANFSIDNRGGRLGLTYQRKQPLEGSLPQRIAACLASTRQAADLLRDLLTFRHDEIEFRICDRLAAPNTAGTLEMVKPALLEVFPGATLMHAPSGQELFTVMIRPRG